MELHRDRAAVNRDVQFANTVFVSIQLARIFCDGGSGGKGD
jgi:methylphosphotriester-DNA--protein-cysteine methyltransferase